MKGILKVAKIANGRSRACAKCKFRDRLCSPTQADVCRNAFIEGFSKGANFCKENL